MTPKDHHSIAEAAVDFHRIAESYPEVLVQLAEAYSRAVPGSGSRPATQIVAAALGLAVTLTRDIVRPTSEPNGGALTDQEVIDELVRVGEEVVKAAEMSLAHDLDFFTITDEWHDLTAWIADRQARAGETAQKRADWSVVDAGEYSPHCG